MEINKNIYAKLTDEQKKLVEDAKTPEDLFAAAKSIGLELTPEQLEAVAGGVDVCWEAPDIHCGNWWSDWWS